ncbi:aromatic motif membrane protein [Mycoplasma seminis]|uniref:Aromatic cluster surface protein n=1 Tax=Mycoplasma seminis TaxID=512749 RepID=A0ABY9HCD0_9MOLU|nr:aromatic motif membrane protein [Mycoplasma seminis]WLP85921.1 hypothetical protein Q8852_02130 [Mycoplasma seminis]
MKKWLRNSLIFTSTITPLASFALVSCSQTFKDEIKLKPKKEVSQNEEFLNEMVAKIFTNNKAKNLYIEHQNAIEADIYTELKASLIYAPVANIKVLKNSDAEKLNQVTNSIFAIESMLKDNWYWYLNHLSQDLFILNPFDAKYKDITSFEDTEANPKNTQALFDYANKKYGSYGFKVPSDVKFVKALSFELQNKPQDIYQVKAINYIILTNNTFIPYFIYQTDKKFKIQIIPDLFVLQSEQNIEEQIKLFNQAFLAAYDEKIARDAEYNKNLEEENPQTKAYLDNNDQNLFKMYNVANYSTLFFKALLKVNDQKLNLLRYSWGGIDEN